DNVLHHLQVIAEAVSTGSVKLADVPLIFLRVRNPDQFRQFLTKLDATHAEALTGFVFPKFYTSNATEYLELLAETNARLGTSLYGMPILEGRTIAYRESRSKELEGLRDQIEPYKAHILNIRVGGTDFSSIFGVRRGIN